MITVMMMMLSLSYTMTDMVTSEEGLTYVDSRPVVVTTPTGSLYNGEKVCLCPLHNFSTLVASTLLLPILTAALASLPLYGACRSTRHRLWRCRSSGQVGQNSSSAID